MEQVNEAQPQSQPPSQRFYALEQLGELAGTITLISEGLQAYRAQVAGLLAGQKKAEAFELYRLLERQRTYLVEQIRATRPFLMELENPLACRAKAGGATGSLSADDRGLLQTDRSAEAVCGRASRPSDHRRLNHRAPDEQCPAGALPHGPHSCGVYRQQHCLSRREHGQPD